MFTKYCVLTVTVGMYVICTKQPISLGRFGFLYRRPQQNSLKCDSEQPTNKDENVVTACS
jgi:hypothetical protein